MQKAEQRSFTSSDGIRIRYQVTGTGPAVALLHGFSMSSSMWWDNGVVETLASSYRLLVPDMRGHGGSDCPHDPANYGKMLVSDVADMIAIEAPSGAHVVGFSMGAELSLPLAVEHPAAVRSIYLIGSGWSPLEIVEEYRIHMEWARASADRDSGKDLIALSALVEAVEATVGLTEEQIAALDLPLAGVCGEFDVERPNLERLARARSDFNLDTLPGIDHMQFWKDPKLPEKICEFLASVPS